MREKFTFFCGLTWRVFYHLNLNANMKAFVRLNELTNWSDTFPGHLQMPL